MSEGRAVVVQVGDVTAHPNADALDRIRVWDYPVIVRRGDFVPGDLAVYIPVDSMVPEDDPRFEFLGGHLRIKAKRLRGIFSMGLLLRAEDHWVEGQDVTEALRITRYEPGVHPVHGLKMATENEPDGSTMPIYTDIEGLRRWPDVLQVGEAVVVCEKLHGANGRFCWHDGRLWVGSHKQIKRYDPMNLWWRIAELYDLESRLARFQDMAIYGEVFGQVQDLRYGHDKDRPLSFAVFDAMDLGTRRYLDWSEFVDLCESLELSRAPLLAKGPWDEGMRALAEGQTTLGGDHVREGFVVRPEHGRWHDGFGRVILKLHGQGYLLRKGR